MRTVVGRRSLAKTTPKLLHKLASNAVLCDAGILARFCSESKSLAARATLPQEMAKKKKTKKFRAVTAVKELARERIGTPPPTQVVPDRKKSKKQKHKPTLGELLEEE
jgi:hypothetical protein